MFCPKCGAQNRDEQKFCRGCGQSLWSVRMALEGRVDEAILTLEKDLDRVASGALTLAIFAAIALIVSIFSGSGSAAFNLLLGLLIAGPMIYSGVKRLNRSVKLLKPKEQAQAASLPQAESAALEKARPVNPALPPVPDTDPLEARHNPSPVTEHTTLQLKKPDVGPHL